MKNNLNPKLTSVIVLICAFTILVIYLIDLRKDYYFHFTGKEVIANIEQIEKVKEYKPYILTLTYLNIYTGQREKCLMKLDGRFGGKIVDENLKSVEILYTERSPCDIYIKDYKVKTIGGTVLHIILTIIAFSGVFIFLRKLRSQFSERY